MKVSLVLCALISCTLFISISGKSPILIVPGLMGSQLKAKVKSLACPTGWKYKLFWIGKHALLQPCLYQLKLRFRKRKRKFYNKRFVRVKVYTKSKHFGRTKPVKYISDVLGVKYKYLKSFLKYFAKEGYREGTNIAAAAYDWRLSPYELKKQGYFRKVRALIEKMFKKNEKKRITIVGHSYGGVVMLYFLRNMVDQTWKNMYIKAFIPLGAPFGGATKIIGALQYGELPQPIDHKIVKIITTLSNKLILLPVVRTFPSLYFLAPRPDVFKDKKLVKWEGTSYTAKNYKKLLTYPAGYSMYQATKYRNKNYHPGNPGVDTYCMYGTGKKTPDWYKVRPFRKVVEKKDNGGDGTVDLISLKECEKWSKNVTKFPGVDHMQIVTKCTVLKAIRDIVLS